MTIGRGYIWPLPVTKAEALVCQILPGQLQWEEIWGVGGEEGRSIQKGGPHSAQAWRWEEGNQVRTKLGRGSTRSLVPEELTLTWVLIRGALDALYASVNQLAKLSSSLHPLWRMPTAGGTRGAERWLSKTSTMSAPTSWAECFLRGSWLTSQTCLCQWNLLL